MKFIITLLSMLLLSGCVLEEEQILSEHIARAEQECEDNKGLKYIEEAFLWKRKSRMQVEFLCNDNTHFKIQWDTK